MTSANAGWTAFPLPPFCIHGNHEMRPTSVPGYEEITWRGGTVYRQAEYPSLLFAKDGEIYDFDGCKAVAIGGAYSVDKFYRLEYGYRWFEDEQPDDAIKRYVESKLNAANWTVDVVLSHTCPMRYIPVENFISGIDQSTVDNATEEWLGELEGKLSYREWYCGHFHTEKTIDKLRFMFEDICALGDL